MHRAFLLRPALALVRFFEVRLSNVTMSVLASSVRELAATPGNSAISRPSQTGHGRRCYKAQAYLCTCFRISVDNGRPVRINVFRGRSDLWGHVYLVQQSLDIWEDEARHARSSAVQVPILILAALGSLGALPPTPAARRAGARTSVAVAARVSGLAEAHPAAASSGRGAVGAEDTSLLTGSLPPDYNQGGNGWDDVPSTRAAGFSNLAHAGRVRTAELVRSRTEVGSRAALCASAAAGRHVIRAAKVASQDTVNSISALQAPRAAGQYQAKAYSSP